MPKTKLAGSSAKPVHALYTPYAVARIVAGTKSATMALPTPSVKAAANQIFKTIEDQEKVIAGAVKTLSADAEGMKQLIGYEWIQRQWEGVN
ncbi:MAG: hypothetical protein HY006_01835 [Candidatus Sungbacteria bacterium]|nr:hypothetical protein [Candidatus Sungbacteria bacterium]